MKTLDFIAVLAGFFLFGIAIPVVAAPQTVNTALPVAEGEFVFRQQFFNKKANNDPGLTNRNVNVLGSVSVLGYGINKDLSIFGVMRVCSRVIRFLNRMCRGGLSVLRRLLASSWRPEKAR